MTSQHIDNFHMDIAQRISTILDLDFHVGSLRFALTEYPAVQCTNATFGCPINFKRIWDFINSCVFILANNPSYSIGAGVSHKGDVPTDPIHYSTRNLEDVNWPLAVSLWHFIWDTELLWDYKASTDNFWHLPFLSKAFIYARQRENQILH